jgi:hypothetical protein
MSPQSAATATQAANQKIMVTASTAAIAYLCARFGKREGVMTRYATARRVQMEVKSMKSTLSGDHPHQKESTTMGENVRRAAWCGVSYLDTYCRQ